MEESFVPFETYKYIHAPQYPRDPAEVMETHYKSIDKLRKKFVVYREGGYQVHANRCTFLHYLSTLPEDQRVFHEVIFSGPQKLKFDIDATPDTIDAFVIETPTNIVTTAIIDDPDIMDLIDAIDDSAYRPTTVVQSPHEVRAAKYTHIFTTILQAIRDAFFITYERFLPEANEIICESRTHTCATDGEPPKKYSNHIIIGGYYVADHNQAREFTRRVLSFLAPAYRSFVDASVNKSIQNFRITGCHKSGDTRVKRIVSQHSAADTLITNTDNCVLLPDIARAEPSIIGPSANLTADTITAVVDLCNSDNEIKLAHRYKYVRGGIFIFERKRSSHCSFCDRVHDTDNTLFVTVKQCATCTESYTVYKHCRRYTNDNKRSGKKIGYVGATPPDKNSTTTSLDKDYQVRRALENIDNTQSTTGARNTAVQTLFDNLAARNIYAAKELAPFELAPTLIVRAAMKMGKTKALVAHIAKHFSDGLRQSTIRFISFRQTFSSNIKEKFADFILYSDVKGALNIARLIIQVESLYRLDIHEGVEPPDLLILDECESIFEQFDSGLLRGNFNECFSKFQYLLRYSRHVICMDANVGDRTFRILKRMRPDFELGAVYHYNTYQNATEDNYYISCDKLKWLGMLYSAIETDDKIGIPMSSLNEAKVLYESLTQRYSHKKIKLYSSETAISEKHAHFADVNTFWAQYDVLIYTPTVSAGVSFEREHFDKIFGYFTDQSCPVETCQQMIGRIRNVTARQYFICIAAGGNNLSTDIETLKRELYARRESLICNFDETGLRAEYGPTGDVIYHESPYFYVWLENTRIRNLSKNSFVQRFIYNVSLSGAGVHLLSDEIYEYHTGMPPTIDGNLNDDLTAIEESHKANRGEIRARSIDRIVAAPDLPSQELEDIHNAIIAQEDITETQRAAFERHRLRVDYDYHGEIDAKFVRRYHNVRVRRVFKNLSRVYPFQTADTSLANIQAEERSNHTFLMSLDESAQYIDIRRKYVFNQHRFALAYLKLCGWVHIDDAQYIHKTMLLNNLAAGAELYWKNIKAACAEFEIKTPSLYMADHLRCVDEAAFLRYMLKPINKILERMYGIYITTKKKEPDLYLLEHNTLFAVDRDTSLRRHIPLIKPIG